MWLYRTLKKPLITLAAVAVLGVAVFGFFTCRGCGDRPRPAEMVTGKNACSAPPGWTAPPTETTPWLPFKRNVASARTAGFPPGSRVVEVAVPPGAATVEIGILPGGEVVVPQGTTATVYVKRPALVDGEVRPWLGGGAVGTPAGINPAVAAGVDLVRAWRVHAGPGVVASKDSVAGIVSGGVKLWRNVDVRVAGGYGTAGAAAFVGVSIGIE